MTIGQEETIPLRVYYRQKSFRMGWMCVGKNCGDGNGWWSAGKGAGQRSEECGTAHSGGMPADGVTVRDGECTAFVGRAAHGTVIAGTGGGSLSG